MNCLDYVDLISDYIENDLPEEEKSLFEEHFSGCEDCKSFLRSFQSSLEVVEYLKNEPCPPIVEQKLQQMIGKRLKEKQS